MTCNICRYKKNLHKKRQTGSKNLASCLRTDNKKMYILSSENEMLAGLFLPSVSLFLFIRFPFYFYINLPHHNISVYLNRHIYVCAHFVFLFLSISVYLSLYIYITVYLNQYIYFYVHISLFLSLFSYRICFYSSICLCNICLFLSLFPLFSSVSLKPLYLPASV